MGLSVYAASNSCDSSGDASPYTPESSRRHARQAKPSAVDDTFVSTQVSLGSATSSLSDFLSERTMVCVAAPWNWTLGAGEASLSTVA